MPIGQFLKNVQYQAPDPTQGMSGTEKFLAGAGKAFTDIGRGVGQIAGVVPQSSVDESRALDAPLMKTGAGIGGNVVGNMAAFAPTMFIPGANTYTGAATLGATMGALAPTATGESRLLNAGIGAGAGLAGQGIGRLVGRIVRPVTPNLSPEQQTLAQAAQREGIPLSLGQQTGSKPIQMIEAVQENLPFSAGPALASKEAQKQAFARAVLQRAGINSDVATPTVLAGQKAALGRTFSGIANNSKLDFNQGLTSDLANIVGDAQQHLPPDAAAKVAGTVDRILSQVDQTGAMSGNNYQGWRTPLSLMAKKGDETSRYFGQIKKALDSGFTNQLGGGDAAAWDQASRQYANLKTIMRAMGGAGAGTKVGEISPAQLEGAFTAGIGREGKALGRGDLNPLIGVGRQFVSENIPDSGTAQRNFYTRLLTGQIAGAIPGGAAGYYETHSPEGAIVGAALGAGAATGGPRLVQALMNSPAGRAYLTRGAIPLTEGGRAALANALRTLAIGGAMTEAQQ